MASRLLLVLLLLLLVPVARLLVVRLLLVRLLVVLDDWQRSTDRPLLRRQRLLLRPAPMLLRRAGSAIARLLVGGALPDGAGVRQRW